MYAYVMAAITLDLPHTPLADQMAHVSSHLSLLPPEKAAPLALHFCQDYNLTKTDKSYTMTFKKHDWHQQSLLRCDLDSSLFLQRHGYNIPPSFNSSIPPPFKRDGTDYSRDMWMIWHIHHHFPILLHDWQLIYCENGVLRESVQ